MVAKPFGYLLKPLEEHELYSTIEMALYRHQTEREMARQRFYLEELIEEQMAGYIRKWIKFEYL
jgi:AmiR/NasT family two-component response regulator